MKGTLPNRLAKEQSPYLLQHAHNPVDWHSWGEEALSKAASENKPILLSIGYSACHWCHVMAHESFEEQYTAQLMNQWFINIKVDREERPDLDKIYQQAHQLLTGNPGGWPLTVFLEPIHRLPFFTGTYFPKKASYHLPAFCDLLKQLHEFYDKNCLTLQNRALSMTTALQSAPQYPTLENSQISLAPWQQAIEQLRSLYDPQNGGFGKQPKFPNPMNLELLIHDATSGNGHADSFSMMQHTLTQMALGGIYDQIGGGFYRYSVDAKWEIPHFEKMLYDNAQLLYHYAQAYLLNHNPLYEKIITETATWITQHMQSVEGGYCSAFDADSEGKEGAYYLWEPQEVKSLLSSEENKLFSSHFNLYEKPNFENHWHLHVTKPLEQLASGYQQSLTSITNTIDSARLKLLSARSQRIPPALDDKLLTAWNALTIKGLALAGASLEQSNWLDSAERCLDFIYKNLWQNGRLLASYRQNCAYLAAYVDDYAFLLDAILTLLQHRWRTCYLSFAQALAEALIEHFLDREKANFFFTANDHEKLPYRPKTLEDNVIPSGSGVACYAIQRLGYLLAEPRYLDIVERSIKSARSALKAHPLAHISLLLASKEHLIPPRIVILRGEKNQLLTWQATLQKHYNPATMIFMIDQEAEQLPTVLTEKHPIANEVTAYVCQGYQCLQPVTKIADLVAALNK